jgi:uncharacterized membrane protein
MGIGMIAVVVIGVVLIVYLVRATTAQHVQAPGAEQPPTGAAGFTTPVAPAPQPAAETPREIVQRRYAAGEIDREEYLQKLADL